jgi:LacI family transcriptional regulator
LSALHDAGVKVPEEIAVIGVANLHYAGLLRVPLSSVDQDSSALGEEAAKLALRLIETKTTSRPKKILLEPKLVVRASSLRNPQK